MPATWPSKNRAFGDASTSAGGVGGVTRWEGISCTPDALAPIPEPSAAVLMVTGAGLALGVAVSEIGVTSPRD